MKNEKWNVEEDNKTKWVYKSRESNSVGTIANLVFLLIGNVTSALNAQNVTVYQRT